MGLNAREPGHAAAWPLSQGTQGLWGSGILSQGSPWSPQLLRSQSAAPSPQAWALGPRDAQAETDRHSPAHTQGQLLMAPYPSCLPSLPPVSHWGLPLPGTPTPSH